MFIIHVNLVVFQWLNISLQKGDMPLFILHVRKVIFQLLNIKKLLFSMLVQKAVFELFNILLQQGANNFMHFLFHAVYIDCKILFISYRFNFLILQESSRTFLKISFQFGVSTNFLIPHYLFIIFITHFITDFYK